MGVCGRRMQWSYWLLVTACLELAEMRQELQQTPRVTDEKSKTPRRQAFGKNKRG